MTLGSDVFEITLRTLFVSGFAALLATLVGLPIGVLIGIRRFRGRLLVKGVFNGMMAMPTVALGLILYLLFSQTGPMGFLHLLYSPYAIIIGQAILVVPIMVSLTTETIESVNPAIRDLALTLGADESGAQAAVLRESIAGILLASSASFSRAISELGVALMLGGNIVGLTRVLTTAIALETARGEVALGIGLAVVLLVVMLVINVSLRLAETRVRWWLWQ
ncbi:MAG: ABC transporter permease [Candidatus Thorarchaeota archaeon]|jgi:tungstate transport system permease protein